MLASERERIMQDCKTVSPRHWVTEGQSANVFYQTVHTVTADQMFVSTSAG